MPFQKGNQLAKNRTSTKNLLPIIRERVLKATNKRIMIDKMLSKIEDVELLRFAMSIMPKDISIKVSPDIQYISNTPRPMTHIIDIPQEVIEHKETSKITDDISQVDLGNQSINSIVNDNSNSSNSNDDDIHTSSNDISNDDSNSIKKAE